MAPGVGHARTPSISGRDEPPKELPGSLASFSFYWANTVNNSTHSPLNYFSTKPASISSSAKVLPVKQTCPCRPVIHFFGGNWCAHNIHSPASLVLQFLCSSKNASSEGSLRGNRINLHAWRELLFDFVNIWRLWGIWKNNVWVCHCLNSEQRSGKIHQGFGQLESATRDFER